MRKQKIKYGFINIMTGSDLSVRKLAVMSAKSNNPGSVVWLTGCVHGDEVGGIAIIQEIFKKLKTQPLIRGSIFAIPIMNPMGFETNSRHIAMSEEDLNRSFPGQKTGHDIDQNRNFKHFHEINEITGHCHWFPLFFKTLTPLSDRNRALSIFLPYSDWSLFLIL